MQYDNLLLVLCGPRNRAKYRPALPMLLLFGMCLIPASGQYIQQGPKVVGSGTVGSACQGVVAISADGNTLLSGAPCDNSSVGSVFVFVRSNGSWVQQGPKLIGSGALGAARQGASVALSADGNTAVIGGPTDNSNVGAAWIFTRSNGTWTQQGSKFLGSDVSGAARQGLSVAISGDGNTAAVGAPSDNNAYGAVIVFVRSNGVWTQQGSKLTRVVSGIPPSSLGTSVALSADGNTALIGAPLSNFVQVGNEGPSYFDGAAWVFTRSNGTWSQQAGLSGLGAAALEGTSVALSGDGNTAVTGGPNLGQYAGPGGTTTDITGAVWVYTRSAGTWVQQAKLLGSLASKNAQQGSSVAISVDGNAILEGGSGDLYEGAAWVFTQTNGSWSQAGSKLVGSGSVGQAGQGGRVALSAAANTALLGGSSDNGGIGAAWVFGGNPPGISSQAYIVGQTPGAARNDFTGFVGMAFTVGPTPVTLTSLGRMRLLGNDRTHLLKLVQASTGADVPGGSVSLDLFRGTADPYAYGRLSNPVTLQANTEYYLLSQELAGGDQWYNYGLVTPTSVAAVNGPAYNDGSHYVVVSTLPNYGYGLVNFLYEPNSVSAPLTVAITSPADGATVSGSVPVTVSVTGAASSVQLQVNGQNVGSPSTTSPFHNESGCHSLKWLLCSERGCNRRPGGRGNFSRSYYLGAEHR